METRSPANSPFAAYLIPALLCLTLGLAPFTPEPHLWGKLRWIVGGASGMKLLDWFDVLLHGAPWAWLIGLAVRDAVGLARGRLNKS